MDQWPERWCTLMAANFIVSFRCGFLHQCSQCCSSNSRQNICLFLGNYRRNFIWNLCFCIRLCWRCTIVRVILSSHAVHWYLCLVETIRLWIDNSSEIVEDSRMDFRCFTLRGIWCSILFRNSCFLEIINWTISLRWQFSTSYTRCVNQCDQCRRTIPSDLLLLGTIYSLALCQYHRNHYVQR